MLSTKYLLVGGGLASAEAVKAIRSLDADSLIALVSEEAHLPYDRPPLSKEFLRGEKERESLLFSPADFYRENKIETYLGVKAESLDAAGKSVTLANGESIGFDKLLIATGGSPLALPIPGADKQGVYYLRTVDDSAAIAAEAEEGKQAVIIGAGFIGIELAASLTQKGVQVTVIEAMSHIWPRFTNEELATYFQRYCEGQGVSFSTSETVERIEGDERPSKVVTSLGRELACDFVCIAVGIRPNVELAESGGLKVDNGIVVDERMQTSHPDIFAAGDVVNYPDPVLEKRRRVEHWGHAEYGGQVAGRNMAGGEAKYDLLSYVWSDIFDLHLEFAGDDSEQDRMVLRGKLANNSFTALYLKGGLLQAYLSVNGEEKDYPVYQRFIRRKKDLAELLPQLEDPSTNLRSLL